MFELAIQHLKKDKINWSKVNMCELGNQKLNVRGNKKLEAFRTGKEYFTSIGCNHTSFDLNGIDGSVILDLSKPIQTRWKNKFNMISNCGTTEHVDNQCVVFENIHNLCQLGGLMIHSIPISRQWRGHCPYHYESGFPYELAKLMNYTVIYYKEECKRKQDKKTKTLLNFILKKNDNSVQKIHDMIPGIKFSKRYKLNINNLVKVKNEK